MAIALTRWVLVILLAFVAVLPIGSSAQPVRGMAGGAATRNVAAYLDLERGLIDAIAKRDGDHASGMLADDFEVRRDAERDALSRADWLQQEMRSHQDWVVHDLSVREYDDIAVVNFWLDEQPAAGKGRTPTRYIVDVWRQSTGRLLVRYVSQPRHSIPFTGRPSGRE